MDVTTFIGRLGADPELRGENGSVATFSVAVNRRWKKDGELQEETVWIPVVAFGSQVEAAKHLHKGSRIAITGDHQLSRWTTADGGNRERLEVRARRIEFLDPAPRGGNGSGEDAPSESA